MSNSKSEPIVAVSMTRSTDFRDIYSNNNRIGVSPVDFNITFSKIVEPAVGISTVEDQVVIRMAPQQFKSFLDSANKTMAAWEEVFGQIKETIKQLPQDRMTEGIVRLKETLDKANS